MRNKIIVSSFIFIVLAAVLISGCLSDEYGQSSGVTNPSDSKGGYETPPSYYPGGATGTYYPVPTPAPTTKPGDTGYTSLSGRKVIMTASISIETGDFDEVTNDARNMAPGFGGYVESSSMYVSSNGQKVATITIKVPQSSFEAAVAKAKSLGKVTSEQTGGQDVTREYIDLGARLKNLQREEKLLSDIMDKAKNVSEILEVERELSRVRGEIESVTGQLNYLNSRVDFSTITMHISEPVPVVGYDWGLDKAVTEAAHRFIAMIGALIVFTGYILPVILYFVLICLLLCALAWLAWKAYLKFLKKKA